MNWLLLSILGTVGAIVVMCCVLALLVRHRINRHHRVHPQVPTPAPLLWMADPRAAARLHRRLAKVGHTAGYVADDHRVAQKRLRKPVDQPEMVAMAEELRRQAVNLDQQVARTAQLPSAVRRSQLHHLTSSVSEAEFACVQLVSVSAHVQAPANLASDPSGDITQVAGQLERLADAHRALEQIDQQSGLGYSSALAACDTETRRSST